MDDARKEVIAKLAAKAHDAQRYYEALGMMNTAGKTAEELRVQSIEYAIAAAEAADARAALDAAINGK